ncbi:O-antigen ligase family protein [Sphingomonas panacisoli]|uniref:O-antigen ligase family protein n=1 Tax=Sphingomonas panacisoli TaxID=1813879 RepID=A0A5B8LFX8_9SPHN|nr:O-antigen ligase family protein [Sphingomonas panacisoli]QDZ06971.1 O-antigen ligase family protein [Sphingomonas panacisoli]
MALPKIDIGLTRSERLPAILLVILFVALCAAGGASRDDVLAQAVIRGFAVMAMFVQVVAGRAPELSRYRACSWLLGAMVAVAALQLVPLPPQIWTALPGRGLIASSPLGGEGWRPMNLVPDAGWNSLFSLLVPLSVLVLLSSLENRTVRRVQYLLIAVVLFSALLALLQAAGSAPENPLINGSTDDYGGMFANRNHQAVFLAIGIVVAWFWGFQRGGHWRDRRLWLAVCVVLLLSVSILVTGSRTGVILGGVAIMAGPFLARPRRGKPAARKTGIALWIGISLIIAVGVLLLSSYFGRAASLNRATTLNLDADFRLRALPTVLEIAKTYFPFGAGLGSFDPVFRSAEPFALLEPTYFNHAHNDLLETVIETGIFGPIILLTALIWLFRRMIVMFSESGENARMGRLGALIVGLVVVASVSDYPVRTPMFMVIMMVAGCWLTGSSPNRSEPDAAGSALPSSGKFL